MKLCPRCQGSGWLRRAFSDPDGTIHARAFRCPDCNGDAHAAEMVRTIDSLRLDQLAPYKPPTPSQRIEEFVRDLTMIIDRGGTVPRDWLAMHAQLLREHVVPAVCALEADHDAAAAAREAAERAVEEGAAVRLRTGKRRSRRDREPTL